MWPPSGRLRAPLPTRLECRSNEHQWNGCLMKTSLRIPLLLASLAGCMLAVSSMSLRAADNVIKIGALLPISGPGSYFGVQDKQGVELALDQLESGVNGYKFDVHYEDSACSPLPATQAAKRLLDQYQPDVVIGEECSDATLAVMPLMDQAKIPLLNAGSSSIKITDPGNPYTFRIMPNEVMQGVDLATNAYKHWSQGQRPASPHWA